MACHYRVGIDSPSNPTAVVLSQSIDAGWIAIGITLAVYSSQPPTSAKLKTRSASQHTGFKDGLSHLAVDHDAMRAKFELDGLCWV